MVLTTQQKAMLSAKLANISTSFNRFKTQRDYMAVYITDAQGAYITFSNENNFPAKIDIGRKSNFLVCVYDCNLNFTTQTNDFLTL